MKNTFIFCLIFLGGLLSAQKTESPYLQVLTKNAIIPLKSTIAEVDIVGKIAHVKVTQVYQNEGNTPIEARYVFPMSIYAAVHDMKMKIGDRVLSAVVYEKKKANKVYKKALKEGKRASKLEQNRPNVFQMNVGNIMPHDKIEIIISYTEMIQSKHGQYQFVFPGVVGPRFTGEAKQNEETFTTAHTPKGTAQTFSYDIQLSIQSGLIIQKVNSTSHGISVHYPDATMAEVTLTDVNNASNRDFILNYSLRGNKIQGGLLLYKGEKENYFAFQIEPPKSTVKQELPPREYLFVVDVSGSMMGYHIKVSKSLMRNLLSNLRPEDSFNVLLFSADNKVFAENAVAATEENIKSAFQFLTGRFDNYGGGTRLLQALKRAYEMPKNREGTSRTMVIITDGYVNVEKETFELIAKNLNKANVTTFGIGSSVNRYLIEGMSRVGKSISFIASNPAEAYKVAEQFREYIATPLLTQIQFESNDFDVYDVEPKSIPDVFSERPLIIYGKYKGSPTGNIKVSGYLGKQKVSKTYLVKNGRLSQQNKALKYLWARNKISELGDYTRAFGYQNEVKEEITRLGIQYNLATKYTSFVAVDTEVIHKKGKLTQVNQLLPLPQNVSNSAVGASAQIRGVSSYKRSYSITIEEKLRRPEVRHIKMWLKGSHSQLIKNWLTLGNQIRIVIDKMGKIVTIEIDENGVWTKVSALKSGLYQLPNHIHIKKEITIIIK